MQFQSDDDLFTGRSMPVDQLTEISFINTYFSGKLILLNIENVNVIL